MNSPSKDKDKTADDLFEEYCTVVCLLHLVAMGELTTESKLSDARYWYDKLNRDCRKCKHFANCLCTLYTQV